ncbi:MAG: ribbon-helix-helix protein, CopG family [Syntrophorhabdales bacterium]|jgi:predicted transcriptional regulator
MSDAPKRQTYSVRLRPEVIDRLRHFAIDEHASLSDLLERAIEDLLEKAGRTSREGGR